MGLDVERNFGRETGRAVSPDGLINYWSVCNEYNVRGQKIERDGKRRDEIKGLGYLRGLQGNGTMLAISRFLGLGLLGSAAGMGLGCGNRISMSDIARATTQHRAKGEHPGQRQNESCFERFTHMFLTSNGSITPATLHVN